MHQKTHNNLLKAKSYEDLSEIYKLENTDNYKKKQKNIIKCKKNVCFLMMRYIIFI